MDYLMTIPDELKLSIFSYLDSFDVVSLARVSTVFEHLTYDKKLIGTIRLYREYRCTKIYLREILLHKMRRDVITSLNINCLYWISRVDLKRCLKQLKLQVLYAVDTKLVPEDLEDVDVSNLHTLAVTVAGRPKAVPLSKVRTLCLHYGMESCQLRTCFDLISRCDLLEELWLIDLSGTAVVPVGFFANLPKTIRKVVASYDGALNPNGCHELRSYDVIKTKSFLHLDKPRRFARPDLHDDSLYESGPWHDFLVRLKCDFPFGIADARKLSSGVTLDSMPWRELNVSHAPCLCNVLLRRVLEQLLLALNARTLRKLSANTCLCQSAEATPEPEPLFKRPRKVARTRNSLLERIVAHSPDIEELELWECSMTPRLEDHALSSLSDLRSLRKLTLCSVPNSVSARYVVEVCEQCVHLTTLRISSQQTNSSLNNHVCMAMPRAASLRDLRFENTTMPVCRLLESFCVRPDSKLERLVLNCDQLSQPLEQDTLKNFVEHNPRLMFVCLCLTGVSKENAKIVGRELNKAKRPEQVFVVVNDVERLHHVNMPQVHRWEMVECTSHVASYDVFNDFSKN